MKFLILLMLPSLTMADIEYKVSQLDYRLWDAAKFPVTLHTIGYIKNVNGFTLGIRHGGTDTQKNEYKHNPSLQKKISRFWSFSGGYSYFISGVNLGVGINYTEYKESGNNYSNSDTGNGYYISADYRINQDYSIGLSKDTYYKKYKSGYGNEITNGVGIYLTYTGI